MKCWVIVLFVLFLLPSGANAEVVKGLTAEGSCAVIGMTAEQCQLVALQRARAAVIEQASGVAVSSSTLVTDFKLAADFIKTYSKGLVVKEKAEWLPLSQYQKDQSTAPIPEYRVRIVADVFTPTPKVAPIGLSVKMNRALYRSGEQAQVEIHTGRKAYIAIFNLMANDNVVMIFPNRHDTDNLVERKLLFPSKSSTTELIMQTLPEHERDAEALLVAALDPIAARNFTTLFSPDQSLKLTEFFRRYAELAEWGEDAIIAYEVVKAKGR